MTQRMSLGVNTSLDIDNMQLRRIGEDQVKICEEPADQ